VWPEPRSGTGVSVHLQCPADRACLLHEVPYVLGGARIKAPVQVIVPENPRFITVH
jgi:hypothetical protein